MDDDTLNSPNNDDIEPTEIDDHIEVLSDNDVDQVWPPLFIKRESKTLKRASSFISIAINHD